MKFTTFILALFAAAVVVAVGGVAATAADSPTPLTSLDSVQRVLKKEHYDAVGDFVFTDSRELWERGEHRWPERHLTRRNRHGHSQPHADDLFMSFKAHGHVFRYELHADHDLLGADLNFHEYAGDRVVTEVEPTVMSYVGHRVVEAHERRMPGDTPDEDRAHVVVLSDGRVHAKVVQQSRMYTLDPVADVAAIVDMADENAHVLHRDPMHLDDILSTAFHQQSGIRAADPRTQMESTSGQPMSRKLLRVLKWNDCWVGQASGKRLAIGIVADPSYIAKVKKERSTTPAAFNVLLSDTNIVYQIQLSISLTLVKTNLQASCTSTSPTWCDACVELDAHIKLDIFRDWFRVEEARSAGLWHMMTACKYLKGVGGIAYVTQLCNTRYGVGMTSSGSRWQNTRTAWETFAHEIGHNAGAQHSFEEGQGKTGGLMDYGDGKLNGEYQFNTKYRKVEMCQHLNQSIGGRILSNQSRKCWLSGGMNAVCKEYSCPSTHLKRNGSDRRRCTGGSCSTSQCCDPKMKCNSKRLISLYKPVGRECRDNSRRAGKCVDATTCRSNGGKATKGKCPLDPDNVMCCSDIEPVVETKAYQCPDKYQLKTNWQTRVCHSNGGVNCSTDDCCEPLPTCGNQNIRCPANYHLKISPTPPKCASRACRDAANQDHLNTLMCTGGTCYRETCCDPNPTCSTIQCAFGSIPRTPSSNIICQNDGGATCGQPECCEGLPTCKGFKCPSFVHLRKNAELAGCATKTCQASECCVDNRTCQTPTKAYNCPRGQRLVADASTRVCKSNHFCRSANCCEVGESTTPTPPPTEEPPAPPTPLSGRKFRADGKCGKVFPAPGAEVGECNPLGDAPCCSGLRSKCGSSKSLYCKCSNCVDYREVYPDARPPDDTTPDYTHYYLGNDDESCETVCSNKFMICDPDMDVHNSADVFDKFTRGKSCGTNTFHSVYLGGGQPGLYKDDGGKTWCSGYNDVPASVSCKDHAPRTSRVCKCASLNIQ